MSWPEKKKKSSLWNVILLYATTMDHFSIRLWCVMTSGFYMTTSNDQLRGWTKKTLQSTCQSQTLTKKRVVVTVGGLQPAWATTAFWILVKALYLRGMLSKMRCTENCNACRKHRSTERVHFSTAMPDRTSHNQCFKSLMNWTTKFCLICHMHLTSHEPATTSSSISTAFFQGKCFHNHQVTEKCFPRISKQGFLCYTNKQT